MRRSDRKKSSAAWRSGRKKSAAIISRTAQSRRLLDRRGSAQHEGPQPHLRLAVQPTATAPPANGPTAATGEHGDLLDIIASAIGADRHADALAEAERFLGVRRIAAPESMNGARSPRLHDCSPPASRSPARRPRIIFARAASIQLSRATRCDFIRPATTGRRTRHQRLALPAMLAAVTDNDGRVTGLMRTYLSADGSQKAPIDAPRRAMGRSPAMACALARTPKSMAAGEGIETMLSLAHGDADHVDDRRFVGRASRGARPAAAIATALHRCRPRRRRTQRRRAPCRTAERRWPSRPCTLTPQRKDFNDDLIADGADMLAAQLADQLTADDRQRFLSARGR